MVAYKFLISANMRRMQRIALLASFWIVGILFGLYAADRVNASSVSFIRNAVMSSVSFIGLFAALMLPLIASAVAMHYIAPLAFLPIAFCKAFGFAFCSFCVLAAFGSAGWLVRCLFLFSDSCMSLLLLWFWFRNIDGTGLSSRKDLAACAAVALCIGCIDYFVISPFLVGLFQ